MTTTFPRLVGMVHLQPLPGSPRFSGDFDEVLDAGRADASTLAEAGFPALLVENFGDAPFYPDQVPPETVAAMTAATREITAETGLPFGVNVLRNDARAALGIAAVTGAAFIRVNVLVGTMYTDQGPVVGQAAQLLRKRVRIAPQVEIWADVMVKHAAPPSGLSMEDSVGDTVERGLADAIIISGTATGEPTDVDLLARARDAAPKGTRLVVGSGVTPSNLGALVEHADTVIVGSALKHGDDPRSRGSAERAAEMVAAATDHGLM